MSDKPADRFFDAVAAWLEPRRAMFSRPFTIAFAVVDAGGYVLDTADPKLVSRRYKSGCDASILTNTMTLLDIASGGFDLDALAPHQLFQWGGKVEALEALREVLSSGQSAIAIRAGAGRR